MGRHVRSGWGIWLAMILAMACAGAARAQHPHPKKKSRIILGDTLAAPAYYKLAGLGSSIGDSTNTFPYPTAVLQVPDTQKVKIVVRFP
ncbi:MAG TPA: hypothetical protein VGM92_05180, partial [Candidatus Kapabacteria bacterium]